MNRIAVRLALIMALVVAATGAIVAALVLYTVPQGFGRLPPDVRVLFEPDRWGPGSSHAASRPEADDASFGLGSTASLRLFTLEPGFGVQLSLPPLPEVRPLRGNRAATTASGFREDLTRSLLVATLVSAGFGVVLALLLAGRIARPLEAVSGAAARVAAGDLAARVPLSPLEARSGDETTRLAANFNAMAEALQTAEIERKDMIADIAHELRTPLAVMQSRLEALEDGVVPFGPEEIQKLHRQTGLLSRLVGDLRTLSLADAGQLELRRARLDLASLASGVVSGFAPRAEAKGVRLELEAKEAATEVDGDPDRLSQVLGNLLDNALRHTPEGGQVRVTLEPGPKRVSLCVADSGPGLPPEAAARVFDRFYRADASRNRASGGSGLGLAIVKAIVELHGGSVEAGNAPAGGAAFRVALPRA